MSNLTKLEFITLDIIGKKTIYLGPLMLKYILM